MKNRILTPCHISGYVRRLHQEERSTATIEKYLRNIREFSAWLDGAPVTKERVLDWKAQLESSPLSPATINGKLAAVNGLLRFAGWVDCRAKSLKVQRRAFRPASRELTREEYQRLVESAQNSGRLRLALLLEAICATGMRVSETRYLTVEAARAGQAVIRLKGKCRTILLPGKLCRKLLKFAGKEKIVSGEIFRTRDGRPLDRRQIWRAMKSLCPKAGVAPSKVFPHNLRHLFAAAFYRLCHDIVKLADVLGHSSIDTTRIYLLSTGAEHVRCLDRLRLIS